MNNINKIVIHCSATRSNQNYTFEQLTADHKKRGFKTVGYNVYVRKDGTVYLGRPFGDELAHATGFNKDSIALCYEGGLDENGKPKDTRTPQQKQIILNFILWSKTVYPKAEVMGHRDLSPDKNKDGKITPDEWLKDCPCYDVKKELQSIKIDKSFIYL